jgi:hypothetical protein
MDGIHSLFEQARELRDASRELVATSREARIRSQEACASARASRARLLNTARRAETGSGVALPRRYLSDVACYR